MGVLSTFIGMLTDSRSFMSYPRHEYFRRVLCNIFGEDVEKWVVTSRFRYHWNYSTVTFAITMPNPILIFIQKSEKSPIIFFNGFVCCLSTGQQ